MNDCMKAVKILVAITITLVFSFLGLVVGENLFAGTRELSVVFAICSMGAFIIVYCDKK